jgi:hypothetical protein
VAVSVAVPDLGEDMVGGLVAEWYRPDGAAVQPGDPVCRIECAFVAFEVEAEKAGLLRHRRPAGSIERPGVILGHILATGEPVPGDAPSAPANQEPVEPATEGLRGTLPELEPEADSEPEFTFDFNFEPEPEPPQLVIVEPPAPPPGDERDGQVEAEPLEEFEQALIEAVVVPFPRRFAMQPGVPLDEVPGDSVTFETSLFEAPDGQVADSLPVPGGSIPGLALWDPEDQSPGSPASAPKKTESLARIALDPGASVQVLSMSIFLDCKEAERMRVVLAREWRSAGITPLLEDIVFRSVAMALREASGVDSTGALVIVGVDSDSSSDIAEPAGKALRESVRSREAGGDIEMETASWQLVSLAEQGIVAATPQLEPGWHVAFAIGAPDSERRATLTAAYDSSHWSVGSMARLLARAREIFEAPYAMLV